MNLFEYTYKNSWAFYLLAALPLFIALYVWNERRKTTTMRTATGTMAAAVSTSTFFTYVPLLVRSLALSSIIIALARPVDPQPDDTFEEYEEGIDIILSFDVSVSMLARDFKPDRLSVAKDVAASFISKRKNDRIGLVIYESEAFTFCPLTSDHAVLNESLKRAQPGLMEGGTAIGMGLAIAINRLRESTAKSKVIILLTDGVNNSGNIDPREAALIAKEYGIRVYTIGIGSRGMALSPVQTPMGTMAFMPAPVEIDEELLQYIANTADGKYYRATNKEKLEEIYDQIDKLEKTKLNMVTFHKEDAEKYYLFAWIAAALLVIEWLLSKTFLRSVYS